MTTTTAAAAATTTTTPTMAREGSLCTVSRMTIMRRMSHAQKKEKTNIYSLLYHVFTLSHKQYTMMSFSEPFYIKIK